MEEKEGRLLRCEEWNERERDRGRWDESRGMGRSGACIVVAGPPLPGNRADQDARLLGNPGDAKP